MREEGELSKGTRKQYLELVRMKSNRKTYHVPLIEPLFLMATLVQF